jgi:hypothetical protein
MCAILVQAAMDAGRGYHLTVGLGRMLGSTTCQVIENVKWTLSGGIGYLHQEFDYEVSNVVQLYPSCAVGVTACGLRW